MTPQQKADAIRERRQFEAVAAATGAGTTDIPVTTQHIGANHEGEYLLTVYADGTHEVAFRPASWETWGRPVKLTAVGS